MYAKSSPTKQKLFQIVDFRLQIVKTRRHRVP
jgi:hypothetical protein